MLAQFIDGVANLRPKGTLVCLVNERSVILFVTCSLWLGPKTDETRSRARARAEDCPPFKANGLWSNLL